eukprot:CAMPEP_0180290744 /NCGR_PEP_ID=MMETSP0988-20121125/15655_1 /TAXON_ID=697907 /ORGANISM="non described non described, Strain CCMP2293" /LENGTH=71 /DNA_ID=CAMNT_0022266329 /DNA_START=511 /DNA_END=726 /DNA_ORIENTATION=+
MTPGYRLRKLASPNPKSGEVPTRPPKLGLALALRAARAIGGSAVSHPKPGGSIGERAATLRGAAPPWASHE